jgi:hypothetical protein
MRVIRIITVAFVAFSMLSLILLSGCTRGQALRNLPPVFPLEEQPPEAKLDPTSKAISITKNDVTISVRYWRKYDLDRKFNVGTMTSPFYYKESWKQSEKLDVFYVTIQNNSKRKIIVDVTKFYMMDNRENKYISATYDFLIERFRMRRMMDVSVRNGLAKAREILLEKRLPADNTIKPGEKVEGFVPFTMSVLRAQKLFVHIPITFVPEKPTGRYEGVEFVFHFKHDPAIRSAQPATIRF